MYYQILYYVNLFAAFLLVNHILIRVSGLLLWLIGRGSPKPGLLQRLRNSWVPIPTGVGLTLLAILQWRRLERERNKDLQVAKNWEVTCYKAIPLRSMSRVFGWISETHIPHTFRPYVFSGYAKVFGANLDEMSDAIESYTSLCDFFTRRLKDGVRPVDFHHAVVSPADGMVLTAGRLNSCRVEQVKGVTYSLPAFLGDLDKSISPCTDINHNDVFIKDNMVKTTGDLSWADCKKKLIQNPGNELYQCVIYLAPGDYHRFHSPVEWNVRLRRHFQGELLSVNPKVARWIQDLFSLNERAVYMGEWEHGYFSMTAVGATNVGSIRVYDDTTLHTNTRKWRECHHKDRKLNLSWKKGEEIGEFRMGSTIVLIFEAPPNFSLDLKPGEKVQVGKAVTSFSTLSR